ncbi:hypothetical protein K1719_037665 [Acacia pycnantha]|nr:hypothetical protein K1719_037665 [Acacia pycnantha]
MVPESSVDGDRPISADRQKVQFLSDSELELIVPDIPSPNTPDCNPSMPPANSPEANVSHSDGANGLDSEDLN